MPRKEPRDFEEEYRQYHGKPSKIKDRASRNAARAKTVKEGRVKKGDGKHVDHHDGNPRNNAKSNRRVMSAKANRKKG